MPDTEWTYADGSKATLHEDGSVTLTEPNGRTTHVDDDTGRRTVTPPNPPGGPPVVDNPPFPPAPGPGDKQFVMPDGTRFKFKKGPPPKFQRLNMPGVPPKNVEIDLSNGHRRSRQTPDAQEQNEDPSAPPRTIEPSTHPKPPEETPSTPPSTPHEGGHKPNLKKPKKKPRRKPKAKARPKKKPVGRKKRR